MTVCEAEVAGAESLTCHGEAHFQALQHNNCDDAVLVLVAAVALAGGGIKGKRLAVHLCQQAQHCSFLLQSFPAGTPCHLTVAEQAPRLLLVQPSVCPQTSCAQLCGFLLCIANTNFSVLLTEAKLTHHP